MKSSLIIPSFFKGTKNYDEQHNSSLSPLAPLPSGLIFIILSSLTIAGEGLGLG